MNKLAGTHSCAEALAIALLSILQITILSSPSFYVPCTCYLPPFVSSKLFHHREATHPFDFTHGAPRETYPCACSDSDHLIYQSMTFSYTTISGSFVSSVFYGYMKWSCTTLWGVFESILFYECMKLSYMSLWGNLWEFYLRSQWHFIVISDFIIYNLWGSFVSILFYESMMNIHPLYRTTQCSYSWLENRKISSWIYWYFLGLGCEQSKSYLL